ncbi:MAG: TIGR03617 family F420-dependent LLM class oxidoreductase [Spongiibacteraceae bacterium]|nr:TIGR03617 family F420-dependent LLM class oxidoreductase [Spongiibacteraceae bacterium]
MKIDGSLMFDPVQVGPLAQALEAAGFDGAYTFDGQSDAFIGAAVAATATTRLEIMTSIAVAFARNPMSLAYLANDLQNLSQGRFILGLGTQVQAHIERRYSMPWGQPVARMRETVAAIRSIWSSWQSGERLAFEGAFYRHTLMSPTFSPPPSAHPLPPIYLAAVGPKMTAMAAEVADGVFIHPFNSAQSFAELTLPSLEAGLTAAGRPRSALTLSAQVITATGLSEQHFEQAVNSARTQIAFYGSTPAYLPVLKAHGWEALQPRWHAWIRAGDWGALGASVDDEMLHTFAVVGTPEAVGRQIAQRYAGKVDRISPVVYQPDAPLLAALRKAISAALAEG